MESHEVLKKVSDFYRTSGDFNGIPITDIGEDFEATKALMTELLEQNQVVLNFGDRHPNPHILAFEPEPKDEQQKKLNSLVWKKPIYREHGPLKIQVNAVSCCIYPSKKYLQSVVDRGSYSNNPYTLQLALGEPQLAYRAFNLRILEFYRNDPRYSYETDDISGHISCKTEGSLERPDETFLQTFGFAYDKQIRNRYVAVFLHYLSDLTPEHQQRWKLEEVQGEIFLHPDYAKQTAGHWPERESVFTAFCEEIRIINEMALSITGRQLFNQAYGRSNKPKRFGFLVRPTKEEYDSFVQLLDKMTSDNLKKEFFRDRVGLTRLEKKGDVFVEKEKGTITLLEEWLDKTVRLPNPEPKNEMIGIFREIRAGRSKPSHHVRDDEWNSDYFVKQRELIQKAYGAVRTLRLILANHPRARIVEVPDWLYEAKIWTF